MRLGPGAVVADFGDLGLGDVEALAEQGNAGVVHPRLQHFTLGNRELLLDEAVVEIGERLLEEQEFLVLGLEVGKHRRRILGRRKLHQHFGAVEPLGRHRPEGRNRRRRDAAAVDVLGIAKGRARECGLDRRELQRIGSRRGDIEVGRQIVGGPEAFGGRRLEYVHQLQRAGGEGRRTAGALSQPDRLEVTRAVEEIELLRFGIGAAVGIGATVVLEEAGFDDAGELGLGRRNDDAHCVDLADAHGFLSNHGNCSEQGAGNQEG